MTRISNLSRGARTLRRATGAAIVVALAVSLVACTEPQKLVEGAIQDYTEAPFYKLPIPLKPGPPGSIVRTEKLDSAPAGSEGWRVLYHSTDVLGHDILVSGVVVTPDTPAPAGGRTIVSWGHPTTGAAKRCAPSVGVDPFSTIEGVNDLLKAGYAVAATDYAGMGAAGPDSYLIGTTEGNNVLDAARAAQTLLGSGGSNRLILWGHSQGGQAVLFAAQSAATYAPELNLEAVAVAAPATNLGELLKADIGDVSGVTIGSYAFAAYSSVYGPTTLGATLDSILTPAGVAATPKMAALCLFGQNATLHSIARPLIGHYLSADPSTTQPWATLLAKNTPGTVALPVPLFIAQGATDVLVRPATTAQFAATERALGTKVTYLSIPKTGHGLVAYRALPTLMPWLKQFPAN